MFHFSFHLFVYSTGWHTKKKPKKTELTNSLITPEMLFSLKQKFSWIMYNLCSQYLQSLNSVLQKLFVLQPLKDMFKMRPRRCRQTWICLGHCIHQTWNSQTSICGVSSWSWCMSIRDGTITENKESITITVTNRFFEW